MQKCAPDLFSSVLARVLGLSYCGMMPTSRLSEGLVSPTNPYDCEGLALGHMLKEEDGGGRLAELPGGVFAPK